MKANAKRMKTQFPSYSCSRYVCFGTIRGIPVSKFTDNPLFRVNQPNQRDKSFEVRVPSSKQTQSQ